MGLLRTLLVSAALMLAIGIANAEPPTQENAGSGSLPVPTNDGLSEVRIPEPNTMLFAGLGGLILLMFAIRRK